jgi:multidrug transporter EmrE-like cation transporter
MIFQIYLNCSIFVTSWLVLSYNPIYVTAWGILSAALWMISSLLSIFAIQNVGLAVSQGIWSGFTIIVSFLWGALAFEQKPNNIGLSILGLIMLMVGIGGISLSGSDILERWKKKA